MYWLGITNKKYNEVQLLMNSNLNDKLERENTAKIT